VDPYIFLFNADVLESYAPAGYNVPAMRGLFSALLPADQDKQARFVCLHGDLLHTNLAYRVSAVRGTQTKYGSQIGSVQTADRDLLATVIWDLCDSIGSQWHTLDLGALPRLLGRHNVYAIGVSALPAGIGEIVDKGLQGVDGYAGSFVPDIGNPVHQRLTRGGLIDEPFYVERSLLFDPWESEDPFDPPPLIRHGDEWYAGLPFHDVRYLGDDEDRATLPEWPSDEVSPRGELSLSIMRQRAPVSHLQRVGSTLERLGPNASGPEFEIDTTTMARAADAVVEEKKLTHYMLNADHPEGGPKAQLFKEVLGIRSEDWRYLAAQLKEGLQAAHSILKVRSTEYGVQYHVFTPVAGRNGSVKPVLSAWEVRADEPPRLVTAYLAARDTELAHLPTPAPAQVVAGPDGADRWSRIWELASAAGKKAVAKAVPTPMLVGDQWYSEGAFGFAWVQVRDARRGFARWLVKAERARTQRGKGAIIYAPSHFHDLGRAWAEAFAGVLEQNGIECRVDSRLD
jgi:hypothetical protein